MLSLTKYRKGGKNQLTKEFYSVVHELFMHRGSHTLDLMFNCTADVKVMNFQQCSVCLQKEVVKLNGGQKQMFNIDVLLLSWHIDIMGPVKLCKTKYYIYVNTCYKDRTVYTQILKKKSEALRGLKKCITHYGYKPGYLFVDGAKEFVSGQMQTYCNEDEHIKFHISSPEHPELHGIAERTNRTIGTMATAGMLARQVTKRFFFKSAILYATYLYNRCYHKGIKGIPEEMRMRKPVQLDNIKGVFGCICYYKSKRRSNSKFQAIEDKDEMWSPIKPKGQAALYLGITDGYSFQDVKLFDLDTQQIVHSRNVSFDIFKQIRDIDPKIYSIKCDAFTDGDAERIKAMWEEVTKKSTE